MEHSSEMKSTGIDRVFDIVNIVLLVIVLFAIAYPLYFIIIASISDPSAVGTGAVLLLPKGINFEGYKRIIEYNMLWVGYKNSLIYTVAYTMLSVMLTMMTAYVFTRHSLPGRGFFLTLFIIPMFFNGGLIPTYLTVKSLNLLDNPMILILLGSVSMYNIIITRTFISTTIPEELYESANLDGCTNITYFFKIVIPLSKAIIAVLIVYAVVAQWNAFFNALIYINTKSFYPLQLILRDILNTQTAMLRELEVGSIGVDAMKSIYQAESMKYGIIIVSSLPVLIIYPFAQKYFVEGVMIGSIKG